MEVVKALKHNLSLLMMTMINNNTFCNKSIINTKLCTSLTGLFRVNETIIRIGHNVFKNPSWKEALVIYKCGRGFDLGPAKNKSS